MNASAFQGADLGFDSFKGKKLNQYKNCAIYFADLQFRNSVYRVNLLQFIQARVFYWKIRHTKLHAAIEWRIECEQPLFRSKIGEERTQTRNRRVDQWRALKPQATSSTGFVRQATLALLAPVGFAFFLADFEQRRDSSQSTAVGYFPYRHL